MAILFITYSTYYYYYCKNHRRTFLFNRLSLSLSLHINLSSSSFAFVLLRGHGQKLLNSRLCSPAQRQSVIAVMMVVIKERKKRSPETILFSAISYLYKFSIELELLHRVQRYTTKTDRSMMRCDVVVFLSSFYLSLLQFTSITDRSSRLWRNNKIQQNRLLRLHQPKWSSSDDILYAQT